MMHGGHGRVTQGGGQARLAYEARTGLAITQDLLGSYHLQSYFAA